VTLTAPLQYRADRSLVTIDLAGFTLSDTAYRGGGHIVVYGSSLAIVNGTIRGAHPNPGCHMGVGAEHSHGIGLYGAQGFVLRDVIIENVQGDGVYVANAGQTPSNTITATRVTIRRNGRMGWGIVHGRNILVADSLFTDLAWRPVDVEPDWNSYSQVAQDIGFDGGIVTGWMRRDPTTIYGTSPFYVGTPGVTAAVAPGIAGVTVEGFMVDLTGTPTPHVFMEVDPAGYRVSGISFRNNTAVDTWGLPCRAARTDGLTIVNNKVPRMGAAWRELIDCTAVSESGNA
jgi:hypothetical protein